MRLLDAPELVGRQGESLVPADRLPALANPTVGLTQAVGIVLDILQGHCLGADVAAAERVVRVAFDRGDQRLPVVLMADFDVQPADRFAQVTGTVMQGLGHGRLCLMMGLRATMRPAERPRQRASCHELPDIRQTIRDTHLPNRGQAVYNLCSK